MILPILPKMNNNNQTVEKAHSRERCKCHYGLSIRNKSPSQPSQMQIIMDSASETSLHLNQAKCEIIMNDSSLISTSPIFSQFIKVAKDDMMLLGAPVVRGRAQDAVIQQRIKEQVRAMKRLSLLHADDRLLTKQVVLLRCIKVWINKIFHHPITEFQNKCFMSDLEFSRLEYWSGDVSRPFFVSLGLCLGLETSESRSWDLRP